MNIIWQQLKILTFPFTSTYSFENPSMSLKDYDVQLLFETVRTSFDRLDRIKELKQAIFDEEINAENWVYKRICLLADFFLTYKNDELYVLEDQNEKGKQLFNIHQTVGNLRKKELWFFLKRMIDEDILRCAFFRNKSNNNYKILCRFTKTTDQLLDAELEKGLSETHLHAGAGRSFSFLWTDIMNKKLMNKNLVVETQNGKFDLKKLILFTRIVRIIFGLYLKSDHSQFKNFIHNSNSNILLKNDEILKKVKQVLYFYEIGNIKNNLDEGFLHDLYEDLKYEISDFYNFQSKDLDFRTRTLLDDVLTYLFDDFYSISHKNNELQICIKDLGTTNLIFPETILLLKSFKKLENEKKDTQFKKLFIQYLRAKNIVNSFIVQSEDSGKGLDIFKIIYNRQSKFNLSDSFLEIFHTHFKEQNIKKFEIRISPKSYSDSAHEIKKILREYLHIIKSENYNDFNTPLVGVVFHFIKKKDEGINSCIKNFNKFDSDKFIYYGEQKNSYFENAKSILKLLKNVPRLSNYIVGIDAASGENDTEPYVFKKAYNLFRNEKNINTPYTNSISFTYHVGEDFRDVISGLRHVDEVIEHFKYQSGDRIGHGIVLGIDIEKWSDNNNCIILPMGEYLENLLWEWSIYTNLDFDEKTNITYIENHIMATAEKIFGNCSGFTVRDLYNLYISKFSDEIIYNTEYCIDDKTRQNFDIENGYCECFSNWDIIKLKKALNCKYFIRHLSKKVSIQIDNQRIKKYKCLQEYMKSKISSKGVIVEVCPTSNILIGDYKNTNDFQIENLSSPDNEKVIITINTDDPIVFNTRLNNEFSLVMDIMKRKGAYSTKQILNWIDNVRGNGIKYSFIKDRKMTKKEIIIEVESIISELSYYQED